MSDKAIREVALQNGKRDRRRYRLRNETVDEKICRRAKNRESRRRQRQLGAAENRAAGLTARRCAPQKSSRHGAKRRGGLYSWLVDARATAHDKAWQ